MKIRYTEIPGKSWSELLAEDWGGYQPPFTVNLPIQPAHSPDLIHVNGSLTVCRRRVLPGLKFEDYSAAKRSEVMLVEFALGDPPTVPDFRRSQLSIEEGRFPIARVSHCTYAVAAPHYALVNGLHFQFEYFCSPLPGPLQNLLWIDCAVTNDADIPIQAHARAKIAFPPEEDIFENHYIPFYWDATKYPPCDKVALRERHVLREECVIGKLVSGGFAFEWETEREFSDQIYKVGSFFVPPPLRYKSVRDAIHFRAELAPGETKRFQLALFTNYEQVTPAHLETLESTDAVAGRAAALRHFRSLNLPGVAELVCPAGRWDEIFSYQSTSTLQLLITFPGTLGLMPTQGSSSERHFVWVWEAVCMLLPLLRLGRFEPVRESLEFIFSLQDAGCPPKGRLTSIAGAIGTTGPKWMNSTGAALALASEYYRYSHDKDFLKEYLPRMLRAMDWIVGELRATRKLNPDGTRPLAYGLMPFGCATDGDEGYSVSFTDAYTFRGLLKGVTLLEELNHPQAQEYRQELDQYRADIGRTVEGLRRSDGFIERKIVTGEKDEVICRQFENLVGAFHLAFCDAIDVSSPAFQQYKKYFEQHMAHGAFTGKMDREIMYMGVGEWAWQDIYLRQGEWKKAFAAVQLNLKYGMTQDTHQVQERFSITDPAFCPWQPNGSGNGKVLDMILKSFYFENENTVTLLGGIPFAWLRQNGTTALRNLHTARGIVSLEVTMREDGCCMVHLGADRSGAMPGRIRFPNHFEVITTTNNAQVRRDAVFERMGSVCELSFSIRSRE